MVLAVVVTVRFVRMSGLVVVRMGMRVRVGMRLGRD